MSWSSWSESITKIAREAQRGIDKVLDITEEEAQAQQQSNQLLETNEQTNEIEEPKIEQNEPPETPKPKKKETNGWNNDAWDDDFDVEPVKPVKKVKKLSPRASLKQKKEEKLKRQKSAEKVIETVPPPTEESKVEQAVEVTNVETSEEPVKLEPAPVIPEPVATPIPVVEVVQSVSQLVNETRNSDMENESKEAIIALVEHAEALGNSFQLLNTRLVSREEQLVKLSTSNAELAAKNDDLISQIEFYKEQSEANGDLDQQNQIFRNKIQESSWLLPLWMTSEQSQLILRTWRTSCTKHQFSSREQKIPYQSHFQRVT